MDTLLTFFQSQIDKIVIAMKPTKIHTLGARKPSMGQQESKNG